MDDLIEKFFREDLSESEKDGLGEKLMSSDEAALRFGELAGELYQSFGLPEPKWTGPDELRKTPRINTWKWIRFCLVFSALLGAMGWMLFHGEKNQMKELKATVIPAAPLVKSLQPRPLNPVEENPVLARPLVSLQTKSNREDGIPAGKVAAPSEKSVSVNKTPVMGLAASMSAEAPVNVDQNPLQSFSSLSVQLHLSSPCSLMVEILGANGNELLVLFKGTLTAGTWAFEWNGKLKNGELAPPGKYKIEVRKGSWTQSKEVLIPE